MSAAQLRDTLGRAFATWQAVPTASVQSQFLGFTQARAGRGGWPDDVRVSRSARSRSRARRDQLHSRWRHGRDHRGRRVLQLTIRWSTAASGEAGPRRSGVGGAARDRPPPRPRAFGDRRDRDGGGRPARARFRRGDVSDRAERRSRSPTVCCRPTIAPAISDLYPRGDFDSTASSISGRITKNGSGVFGAHVAAFNLETGEIVGGFTLERAGRLRDRGAPAGRLRRARRTDRRCRSRELLPGVRSTSNFSVTYSPRVVIAPAWRRTPMASTCRCARSDGRAQVRPGLLSSLSAWACDAVRQSAAGASSRSSVDVSAGLIVAAAMRSAITTRTSAATARQRGAVHALSRRVRHRGRAGLRCARRPMRCRAPSASKWPARSASPQLARPHLGRTAESAPETRRHRGDRRSSPWK